MEKDLLYTVTPPQISMASSPCRAGVLLDRFFRGEINSFRECYIAISGDNRLSGRIENGFQEARLLEALDTNSWPDVFSAAVTRRLVEEYRRGNHYAVWRKLVTIARDVNDFRTKERVRYGGYGDLPTVNEGAAYGALTSPDDEKAYYAVEKRGGTESITLEMVRNDDVSAIRRIPRRLAEAAHRTLAHFVLDILRDNPAIYDGVALFHASHNNLGNAALSATALAAARSAMQKQTELGSGDRLGLVPKILWVSLDNEETAVNLFRRGTNQDKTFVQALDLEVVPVWYWTDADDWCVSADPEQCPTIELAFLDGQDEPEVIIQDAPTAGSMFTHDRTTLKIRHAYGGAVIDYRGVYKSVV